MKSEELREKYRRVRKDNELTLREVSNLLGVSPVDISLIENGPSMPLKLTHEVIDVQCHRCGARFSRRGIDSSVLAAWVCGNCVDEETEYQVYAIDWEETERGWGVRPDGCSLHLTKEEIPVFIKNYQDTLPDEVPEEYSRPTNRDRVYQCTITTRDYYKVLASTHGIFHLNRFPKSTPQEQMIKKFMEMVSLTPLNRIEREVRNIVGEYL